MTFLKLRGKPHLDILFYRMLGDRQPTVWLAATGNAQMLRSYAVQIQQRFCILKHVHVCKFIIYNYGKGVGREQRFTREKAQRFVSSIDAYGTNLHRWQQKIVPPTIDNVNAFLDTVIFWLHATEPDMVAQVRCMEAFYVALADR